MPHADEGAGQARWTRLQEVFWAAREVPGAEQERYLLSACGDDGALLREVRQMLAEDEREGILDRAPPVPEASRTLADVPVPRRVGPYVVSEMIGHGGMGVVYRAHDPRLRRDVALKFLPAALHQDREAEERFIHEARAASALDHPHNCPVYDIGTTEDGRLYIAMAWCGGGSLASRLASGPLGIDQAVRVALQVAEALDAAHEAGIIHRDIKPANIAFTERGEARVLDFGIALLGQHEWSAPRFTAGTPTYMAPEQRRGGPVDRRTDVWSLGVVLFEMLTGRWPSMDGEAAAGDARVRLPDELRRLRPEVPAALARVVAKALERDPGLRFPTAAAFAAALRATGAGAPEGHPRRRRVVLAAAATIAAVAALGAYLSRAAVGPGGSAAIDRGAVAILPFRVSAEPALQYLREGMVDLLAAKLTGEGGIRALDPRGVYSAWRRETAGGSGDLTVEAAAGLARRLGAGNVLMGDVVGTPAGLVVNAAVVDGRGATVSRATAEGTHTELSALVDRLAAQLLSQRAGEEPQRLTALTSTSLPALRAYLEGQAEYRRGRYAQALEHYGRALDLDSTFALAGLGLDLADGWVGTGHARERGRAAAWRWRSRLNERDRALLFALAGTDYPRPPTMRERLEATEAALRLSPDRVELWFNLGDLHLHYGRLLDGDGWEARSEPALRRALELDSSFSGAAHHLVLLYAGQGRTRELRMVATEHLEREPTGATADYIRWRLDPDGGPSRNGDGAFLDSLDTETLGWIAITSQDDGIGLEPGRRAARIRSARPGTRDERFERQLSLHAVALNGGHPGQALAITDSIREVQPDADFHLRLRVLGGLYGDGDATAAGRAVELLRTSSVPDARVTRLNRCVVELWRLEHGGTGGAAPPAGIPNDGKQTSLSQAVCDAATAALAASRTDDAARRSALARLDTTYRGAPIGFVFGDGHLDLAPLVLARILERSGDLAGALTAIRRRPYFIGWQPFLAASLRHEGRLAAALGDRAGAVRAYQRYLAHRAGADPALRAAADSVRAELARLSTRS